MRAQRYINKVTCALVCAGVMAFAPCNARAQDNRQAPERRDLLGAIDRWVRDVFTSLDSGVKDTRKNIDNFNHEAGVAAKATADVAKDAADAMLSLPNTKVISGHQNCPLAANGAPDCVSAANNLCKSQGFHGGKSLDTTMAHDCPLPVLLGRRDAQAGECRDVTFVTRAVCQ